VTVRLYSGHQSYESDVIRGPSLFPNASDSFDMRFEIPLGVRPTRLKFRPAYDSFWDFYVPFYNEQRVYDLRS
jgi:hypothetical protein